MIKAKKPKKPVDKEVMSEKDFSVSLKIFAKVISESYKLLENKPFLRKLKEKLDKIQ